MINLKTQFNRLLNFVAPDICFICSNIIEDGSSYICYTCIKNTPLADSHDVIYSRITDNFDPDDLAISDAFALFSFKKDENSGIRELIHDLKYNGLYNIGYELGKLLARKVKNESNIDYDAVIPVPIHKIKKRERGYNQAFHIAKGFSSILNIPVIEDALIRYQYSLSQTKLKASERKTNVLQNFFPGKFNFVNINKFIIIDDVLTTGSTVNSCANILMESGAKRVDVAAIAIA